MTASPGSSFPSKISERGLTPWGRATSSWSARGRTTIRGAAAVVDGRTLNKIYEIETDFGDRIENLGFSRDPKSLVIAHDNRRQVLSGKTPRTGYKTRVVEVALNGAWTREFRVSDFSCDHVSVEDDGRIILIGRHHDQEASMAVVRLDPGSGSITVDRTTGDQFWFRESALSWFSPDGRFALRHHVGSVIRDSARGIDAFLRRDGPVHPDFKRDGKVRYGVALDLYRLVPFKLHMPPRILEARR